MRSMTATAYLGALVGAGMGATAASAWAVAGGVQGGVIDQGAFRINRGSGGAPEVENFRISRGAAGQILATGQVSAGTRRVVSRLVTDSVGSPLEYQLTLLENGTRVAEVKAGASAGRLSTMTTNRRGDESDKDYPLGRDHAIILDDDLVHLLYFSSLSSRTGTIRVISPHAARAGAFTISAHGLEPVDIGGQSVTATHLSLTNGADQRDFWVDEDGRVLKVETSSGLKAVRDELPRKR
jgi:hypothetical protein